MIQTLPKQPQLPITGYNGPSLEGAEKVRSFPPDEELARSQIWGKRELEILETVP